MIKGEKMPKQKLKVNGKIVGEVKNGVYLTVRDKNKHFFWKGKGYPISESVLKRLKELEVKVIRIVEKPSGKVFECDLELYLYGKSFHEAGYDAERCVSIHSLREVNSNQLSFL